MPVRVASESVAVTHTCGGVYGQYTNTRGYIGSATGAATSATLRSCVIWWTTSSPGTARQAAAAAAATTPASTSASGSPCLSLATCLCDHRLAGSSGRSRGRGISSSHSSTTTSAPTAAATTPACTSTAAAAPCAATTNSSLSWNKRIGAVFHHQAHAIYVNRIGCAPKGGGALQILESAVAVAAVVICEIIRLLRNSGIRIGTCLEERFHELEVPGFLNLHHLRLRKARSRRPLRIDC
jgi:hypothetical protein